VEIAKLREQSAHIVSSKHVHVEQDSKGKPGRDGRAFVVCKVCAQAACNSARYLSL
jgi:hypothetical protein